MRCVVLALGASVRRDFPRTSRKLRRTIEVLLRGGVNCCMSMLGDCTIEPEG